MEKYKAKAPRIPRISPICYKILNHGHGQVAAVQRHNPLGFLNL
jgi:hypothetical protein